MKCCIIKGTSDFNKEYRDFEIGLLQIVVNISKHFEVASVGVGWGKTSVNDHKHLNFLLF